MDIIDVGLEFGNMSMTNNPHMGIVHHVEAEGPNWTVQMIHQMHISERGWAGIGYHYYIRLDGSIYKGRPDDAIGAHCQGCNTNTLGIAFEGDYETKAEMPAAQYNAWVELKAYLTNKYGYFPIFGHREKGSSECPGKLFPLEKVRNAVAKTGEWKRAEDGVRWWYSYSDGTFPTSWDQINNLWYLFDKDGYMLTGWKQYGDTWYYLFSDGSMATGWQKLDNKWYYFDEQGSMQTGWLQNNDWFYLDSNGAMYTGWEQIDGYWYYFYSTGQMAYSTTIAGYNLNEKGQCTN